MTEQTIKHLVRVANTDLDGKKPVGHALIKIQGVGFSFANLICGLAKIDRNMKVGSLSDEQVSKLDTVVRKPLENGAPVWMVNRRRDYETNADRHLILADIGFVKDNDMKRMKKIKSYKGMRHMKGLPVRGQRTRSNFRRNKGKVHLGVQRKKVGKDDKSKGGKK
jgi:small subunit ribosomal protein S13